MGAKKSSEVSESTLSRKAAIALYVPVPQTDTGRRGENPQTDGRSVVKELGKMTPELRDKGSQRKLVTEKRLKRLFSKNIGLCETVR